MNGSGLTPSWLAIEIAIGVPMTAAALFDTTLVMIVMIRMKRPSMTGTGSPDATPTNDSARKSAMPVTISALPSARLVTMIMITCTDSEPAASRQFMQPSASIAPTPITALTEIGMMPSAATSTTRPMTPRARLAFSRCGSSVVPSSTSMLPLSLSFWMAAAVPWTSSTSPARSRIDVRSSVIWEVGARAR